MVLSSPCLAPWGDLGTIEGADAGPQLLILPAPGSHLRVTVLGGLPSETQVGMALGQRCVVLLLNEMAPFSKEAGLSAHFPRDSLVTAGAPPCKQEKRQADASPGRDIPRSTLSGPGSFTPVQEAQQIVEARGTIFF